MEITGFLFSLFSPASFSARTIFWFKVKSLSFSIQSVTPYLISSTAFSSPTVPEMIIKGKAGVEFEAPKQTGKKLEGKTFVLTGVLKTLDREEAKEKFKLSQAL